MPRLRPTCLLLAATLLCVLSAPSAGASDTTIDFNRDIRPLLFDHCITCHGPDEAERAAGLRLDTEQAAKEDLGGYAAVVPGDADASELILRITAEDEDMRMPPPEHQDRLSDAEIELFRRWIDQGAPYAKHWSYEIPTRPELPAVESSGWPHSSDWAHNAIDHFTLAKMQQAGLQPAPPADRLALARRVALDVTGLPPTWEEAQAFARDSRRDAYEIYVDSMLAKPAFGERWARVWLDLARYADSAGYADDPPRTIWAYRDYVIKALNENRPFDQFTIEQIAGDLLPEPTEQQLIATAFHRNTLTNNEGGTNDEEFRNVAVVDRVNTTMAVWMGTTMACAQCHTHKYDPITQEEYFRFFAFFNNTRDSDKRDEQPTLSLWSDSQKRRQREIDERLTQLQTQLAASTDEVRQQQARWLESFSEPPSWQVCHPEVESDQYEFETSDDGWITAVGDVPANDVYRVTIPIDQLHPAAIRLETSQPSERNFVITQIQGDWKPEQANPVKARFVRVQLPGNKKNLHLAEIQVFSNGQNVALEASATQSSTYSDAVASRVNDGNTDGDYAKGSVQHTQRQADPWVELDLGQPRAVDSLVLWNRTDGGPKIANRLDGFTVSLLDGEREVVWKQSPEQQGKARYALSPNGAREVRFQSAAADFSQDGFPAQSVIDDKQDPNSGWAIAPQRDRPHTLTLTLNQPLRTPGVLTLTVRQESVHKKHLLERFRLSLSDDPGVVQWAKLPPDLRPLVTSDPEQWSDDQAAAVETYYRSIAPAYAPLRAEMKRLQRERDEMKPSTTVPIMQQLAADQRRETKVQIRGNYQSTGATVSEGTPDVFHAIDHADNPSRLDLARWLVSPENPLTARVIANRHWEQLFGIGIVETSEEFGSQGEPPSHPKLLDWLAVELQDSGWDLKHLLKTIVMSSTYRQSSEVTPDKLAEDPANRLLSRGPRFRLSAEMIRDQALFVSGLLSPKKFGPPVKPPQPELGLKAAFGSATDWQTSDGEDRYRRGIYTTWRRSSPYPSMAQFDAPNREVCTVRRIRTNTPLQALVTLNDPVYVEAAQALARKIIRGEDSPQQRITAAFRACLLRDPEPREIERLSQLAQQARVAFDQATDEAVKMATDPLGPLPENSDPAEFAAWTVVANVILNLDETFMKR
ncbi:DUF1553 domain-containing protein [Roseiconus nitratireducens]|uniref:DUF1553 domain-containing protein n=1 Tax=Roseiconus nitratireducens TaxID=2605748 RepID=A0A5M6DKI7_9BACT|nr:DUF1553 domain-containing protein [Roseiconus nitratireducens]KAA5546886.1 DUF1553 domain-containing protein [Roseiconus nitratireducens]